MQYPRRTGHREKRHVLVRTARRNYRRWRSLRELQNQWAIAVPQLDSHWVSNHFFNLHLLASTVSFIDCPVLPRLIQYGIYQGGPKTNVGNRHSSQQTNFRSVSFSNVGDNNQPPKFSLSKRLWWFIFDGLKQKKKKKTNKQTKCRKLQNTKNKLSWPQGKKRIIYGYDQSKTFPSSISPPPPRNWNQTSSTLTIRQHPSLRSGAVKNIQFCLGICRK